MVVLAPSLCEPPLHNDTLSTLFFAIKKLVPAAAGRKIGGRGEDSKKKIYIVVKLNHMSIKLNAQARRGGDRRRLRCATIFGIQIGKMMN